MVIVFIFILSGYDRSYIKTIKREHITMAYLFGSSFKPKRPESNSSVFPGKTARKTKSPFLYDKKPCE